MTEETPAPPAPRRDDDPAAQHGAEGAANSGRRAALKAALAAGPVLLTLSSRSARAQVGGTGYLDRYPLP